MQEIEINTEFIKLGQLLKMSGIADSGSFAKMIIADGLVKVNGEVDLRRGRKVVCGDIVTFQEESIKVISEMK